MAQEQRDIGQAFLEAFFIQIISNFSGKMPTIFLDKEKISKAVRMIERETFEKSKPLEPIELDLSEFEEDAPPMSEYTAGTEPLPSLSKKITPPPERKITPLKFSPHPVNLPQRKPVEDSPSRKSLRELLSHTDRKSMLDVNLPKFNKAIMIHRRLPRPAPTNLKMKIPHLQPPKPSVKPEPKKEELKKSKEIHPSPPTLITVEALNKLNNLMLDPTVQTIECPGPGKQITVYRSGFIQNTNIFLTTDEIRKIMSEISEITKIPIIPGVFKAALGNFVITSVVSEFVGTRFIIQKKEPSKLD
ncbi:hypothetical protein FJZ18_01180 [Candidatus Pacearchaeota archaeon]|nr:hypothetical protein [Candidatus Pacearchaeota archaeon]